MYGLHVSAPGKVLIIGGYLVLEQPNEGLILGSTSRFHSTIYKKLNNNIDDINDNISDNNHHNHNLLIQVNCPQFHQFLEYELIYNIDRNKCEIISKNNEKNLFVEMVLKYTFQFIEEYYKENNIISDNNNLLFDIKNKLMKSNRYQNNYLLYIKLEADNDFYSQLNQLYDRDLPICITSLSSLPDCLPCPLNKETNKPIINKTGMGSSASLVTSLVSSLLHFFGIVYLPIKYGINLNNDPSFKQLSNHNNLNDDLNIIHNLSQLVHSMAQGKIGSGFDISAAVYGSQSYIRFSKSILNILSNNNNNNNNNNDISIYDIVMSEWDCERKPFSLPPGFSLMMGDVNGGSETPSKVRKVLKWLNDNDNAKNIWNELSELNNLVKENFNELSNYSINYYNLYRRSIQYILLDNNNTNNNNNNIKHDDNKKNNNIINNIINLINTIKNQFYNVRQLLKQIGEESGADIEPNEQTELSDATMNINGVIASGVPGAGGDDAIFAIIIHPRIRENVEDLWFNWKYNDSNRKVCPLTLTANGSGYNDGVRLESLDIPINFK